MIDTIIKHKHTCFTFCKKYFVDKPRHLRRTWVLGIRAFNEAHSTVWRTKLVWAFFICLSKLTHQKLKWRLGPGTNGCASQRELFMHCFGSVVALSVPWQIKFCLCVIGVQSSCRPRRCKKKNVTNHSPVRKDFIWVWFKHWRLNSNKVISHIYTTIQICTWKSDKCPIYHLHTIKCESGVIMYWNQTMWAPDDTC